MGSILSPSKGEARKARRAQEAAERSRLAAEEATQNMQANFATDLRTENVSTVLAGGTADAVTSETSDLLKKKKSGSSVSSTLGINV